VSSLVNLSSQQCCLIKRNILKAMFLITNEGMFVTINSVKDYIQ